MTARGAAAEPLAHIKDFRMDFGDTKVIRDLSFDVRAGETFGFLGSNGSGKTTTLRALLGIYQPTAGTLHIGGKTFEPRDGVRLGSFRRNGACTKRNRSWMSWSISAGSKDSALLILDEPTKGFDPVNRRLLLDIIEDQKLAGSTVIFVTHQVEEVERLCDRVILLKDGTSRAYGTVSEVQKQFGGTIHRIAYTGVLPASALYEVTASGEGSADLAPRRGRGRTRGGARADQRRRRRPQLHHRAGLTGRNLHPRLRRQRNGGGLK